MKHEPKSMQSVLSFVVFPVAKKSKEDQMLEKKNNTYIDYEY